ncbi:hypothetical protein ONE63_000608 [Megalurothrips usitatus]|uniref:Uncharacterized protein n=1 Tax=Megalurothrips usitatus TaxID=439358 RepID=A0AAV7XYZ9_9NEOP|nr:hypothetical protein ONE63_000608 [Megalurothrips usitatus]
MRASLRPPAWRPPRPATARRRPRPPPPPRPPRRRPPRRRPPAPRRRRPRRRPTPARRRTGCPTGCRRRRHPRPRRPPPRPHSRLLHFRYVRGPGPARDAARRAVRRGRAAHLLVTTFVPGFKWRHPSPAGSRQARGAGRWRRRPRHAPAGRRALAAHVAAHRGGGRRVARPLLRRAAPERALAAPTLAVGGGPAHAVGAAPTTPVPRPEPPRLPPLRPAPVPRPPRPPCAAPGGGPPSPPGPPADHHVGRARRSLTAPCGPPAGPPAPTPPAAAPRRPPTPAPRRAPGAGCAHGRLAAPRQPSAPLSPPWTPRPSRSPGTPRTSGCHLPWTSSWASVAAAAAGCHGPPRAAEASLATSASSSPHVLSRTGGAALAPTPSAPSTSSAPSAAPRSPAPSTPSASPAPSASPTPPTSPIPSTSSTPAPPTAPTPSAPSATSASYKQARTAEQPGPAPGTRPQPALLSALDAVLAADGRPDDAPVDDGRLPPTAADVPLVAAARPLRHAAGVLRPVRAVGALAGGGCRQAPDVVGAHQGLDDDAHTPGPPARPPCRPPAGPASRAAAGAAAGPPGRGVRPAPRLPALPVPVHPLQHARPLPASRRLQLASGLPKAGLALKGPAGPGGQPLSVGPHGPHGPHGAHGQGPTTAGTAPIPPISSAPAVTNASSSVITTSVSSMHTVTTAVPVVGRSHSPRGHSPRSRTPRLTVPSRPSTFRSSSGVSSMGRTSVTPLSGPGGPLPPNPSPFSAAAVAAASASSTAPSPSASSASTPVSSSLSYPKGPGAWPSPPPPPHLLMHPGFCCSSNSSSQLSPAGSSPAVRPGMAAAPGAPGAPAAALSSPHPHPGLGAYSAGALFAPPLPPVSAASAAAPPATTNPNPFSAESLLTSEYQADLLRRELDSRFLASQDRSLNVGPPPYLRSEMHHHQHPHGHQHSHPSQHSALMGAAPLGSAPLGSFKDVPKLGGIDSPFYRQNPLSLGSYPYSGLPLPALGSSTPFAPPSHLPTFAQKVADPSKTKPAKSGKWNAMHVRIAWEIYSQQQKSTDASKLPAGAAQGQSGPGAGKSGDLLRAPPLGLPSHLYPGGAPRPHELGGVGVPPSFSALPAHRPPFDPAAAAAASHSSYLASAAAASHLGNAVSPFGRYAPTFPTPTPTGFPPLGFPPGSREMNPLGPLAGIHDPWSRLQRSQGFPVTVAGPWSYKSEASVLEERERSREREREREREQREREKERERERQKREKEREEQRKAEEKRKLDAEREQRERERERREKERRELERREQEREREREKERLFLQHHQQQQQQQQQQHMQAQHRLAQEQNKSRERSPLRNGGTVGDRKDMKEDELAMLARAGHPGPPFPHPYLARLPMLDRRHPSAYSHGVGPPVPGGMWPGPDPYRDAAAAAAYRFDPMRGLGYNPLMALQEEERAKLYGQYPGAVGVGGRTPARRARAPCPSPGACSTTTSTTTGPRPPDCLRGPRRGLRARGWGLTPTR